MHILKTERSSMLPAPLTISWSTLKFNNHLMVQQLSNGLMVAFDFEKAFDSLSWSFLFRALRSFNLGESFIRWVSVLYCNISSCVLNNGFSSQLFEVQRGVTQGIHIHCRHTSSSLLSRCCLLKSD